MFGFLHHLVLPRESNNHRAKLLHHTSLLILIAILILGNIGISFLERNNSQILGVTANFNQDDLLLQTNAKRAENGLPPLQLNPQLSQAAYQKGQDMLAKNYWAHNSPEGTTPWVFIKDSGYQYLYAGENLARGFSSAPDVVNAWMNSQGHKDNLLSKNYDDVGFAVVTGTLTGDETILVVQEFGRKMAGGPPETQTIATNVSVTPVVTILPTQTILPTVVPSVGPVVAQISPIIPSPTRIPGRSTTPTTQFLVASVQSNPLIDSNSFSKNFTILLVIFILSVLVLDIIVIERKKIVRVLSHNIDHIMFFTIILLILIIIGKDSIL